MYVHDKRNFRRKLVVQRRGKRRFLWVIAAVILVVLVQLLYPKNLLTPFTRLDGKSVLKLSDEELSSKIKSYEAAKIKLEIKGPIKTSTANITAKEAGILPDVAQTKQTLEYYPLWQRLLPLSLFARGIVSDNGVDFRVEPTAQKTFISARLTECSVLPKNAGIKIENNVAVLDQSKDGQSCDAEQFSKAFKNVEIYKKGLDIVVKARSVEPSRSNRQVKGVINDANKIISRTITLKVADNDFQLEKNDLASFVTAIEDSQNKDKLVIGIQDDAMRAYLENIEKKIFKAPGDGVLTASKSSASDGRALNYTETMKRLKAKVLESDGEVMGVTVTIPSGTTFGTLYSPTKAGLQTLLDDIVASKGRYGISVRFLDESVVSTSGDVSYHPASTYKMYVAYALLKRIERGEMTWSQASANGTVSHCFDLMILHSDNTCAEWFGSTIGWRTISSEIRALGLTNTSTVYGGQRSTANDETLFLLKLQQGTILRDTERDKLLDVMKRQVYRAGIPAGVGVSVADKVGFLDGDLHDSAIIYSPKQTYVMTIMTSGSSWSEIADAASQIQVQLNRM